MKVGDLVKWSWYLGTGAEKTSFFGVVVSSRLPLMWVGEGFNDLVSVQIEAAVAKGLMAPVHVFDVLTTDGDIASIRADDGTLEVV